MAKSLFTSLCSRSIRMFPSVTLTGAVREGLAGVPGRIVQIFASNGAYWIKVHLPITRRAELVYVTYRLEHETRMRIGGAKHGGEARSHDAVLGERAQSQHSHFNISFDLPGPVSLTVLHNKLCDDGIFEIILLKSHLPPPSPETTESSEGGSSAPPSPPPSSP